MYEVYCRRKEAHVLILGLDHAGKTTLLEQMKGLYSDKRGVPVDKIGPTVGLNLARLHVGQYQATFWDLGGHVGVRSIWQKYYADADAVVFVVDASDLERLAEARAVVEEIGRNDLLHGKPVLVLANKQDLVEARTAADIGGHLRLDAGLQETSFAVRGISALRSEGIEEAMVWLLDALDERGARRVGRR